MSNGADVLLIGLRRYIAKNKKESETTHMVENIS